MYTHTQESMENKKITFLENVQKIKNITIKFQSDMFDNMSIIVLTQIHIMFVHFFGIESVSFYFL